MSSIHLHPTPHHCSPKTRYVYSYMPVSRPLPWFSGPAHNQGWTPRYPGAAAGTLPRRGGNRIARDRLLAECVEQRSAPGERRRAREAPDPFLPRREPSLLRGGSPRWCSRRCHRRRTRGEVPTAGFPICPRPQRRSPAAIRLHPTQDDGYQGTRVPRVRVQEGDGG